MTWKTKERKKGPVHGDKRVIVKFAWLPVAVGAVTVWLERVKVKQVYLCSSKHSIGWADYESLYRDYRSW